MRRRTATRAATRSATSRAQVPLRRADAAGARPRPRGGDRRRAAAVGAARARSDGWPRRRPGKDSVTGHWEMMGVVLERPFPMFPDGFSADDHRRVRARDRPRRRSATRRRRAPRSSTSSAPSTCAPARSIVYTSADSVFQIAAHEDVVPVPELYRACEIAYELVGEGLGVGRVIARPFVGAPGRVHADRQPPRLRAAARRRDAARSADGGVACRSSRSARSRICSPGAASRAPCHTASDDEGMDQRRAADGATSTAG